MHHYYSAKLACRAKKKGTITARIADGTYDVEVPKAPFSVLISSSIQLIYFRTDLKFFIGTEVTYKDCIL